MGRWTGSPAGLEPSFGCRDLRQMGVMDLSSCSSDLYGSTLARNQSDVTRWHKAVLVEL
jgi:hypothetical protein